MTYKLLSYQAGRDARPVCSSAMPCTTGEALGNSAYSTVLGILEDWSKANRLAGAAAKRSLLERAGPRACRSSASKLRAAVLYPGNIYCAERTTPITWPRWREPRRATRTDDEGSR